MLNRWGDDKNPQQWRTTEGLLNESIQLVNNAPNESFVPITTRLGVIH